MSVPDRFAMQGALDVAILGGENNNEIQAFLEDCTTTGLEFSAERVYNMGKNGAYLVGFGHSRRMTANIVNGYPTTEIMAIQGGTSVVTGINNNAFKTEILTVNSDTANTEFTALGDANEEIAVAHVIGSDGGFQTKLTQAGSVGSNEFTYTAGTKLLTFNTGDLADGTKIFVAYNHATDATAKTINFDADKFAGNKKVVFTGLAKSLCGGDKLYKANIIFHKADINDNFTLDYEDTGDPVVQNMTFQALVDRCSGSNTMVEFILYDESLAS